MHEIKIYGDIVGVSQSGENNICLLDVQNMLNSANGQPLKVRLNGDGGDVDEGFAIYYELRRYAKQNKVPVHTFAESRLNSIYTVIFLAGDERELSTDLEPFVHKAYYPEADSLTEKEEARLKAVNLRIAQHYADHTDLTVKEALELMEFETYIPTETAKAMRFATSIEQVLRPVALERFNNKQQTDMNKNTKTSSVVALAQAFMKAIKGTSNKLVMSATQEEIDFYELADDAVVEIGAKARVNGEDAQGDYVMPDGEVYVFEGGELVEKRPAVMDDEAAKLQEEIDNLTTQLEAITNAAKATVEAKDAEIATLNAQVLTFKNATSQAAPVASKSAPAKTNAPAAKENKASSALENLKKLNTKK